MSQKKLIVQPKKWITWMLKHQTFKKQIIYMKDRRFSLIPAVIFDFFNLKNLNFHSTSTQNGPDINGLPNPCNW